MSHTPSPVRIPPPLNLPQSPNAPHVRRPLDEGDYARIKQTYILRDADGSRARWNPRRSPSPHDVHTMLNWYSRNSIHLFPEVASVTHLGEGRTNSYFLVTFRNNTTDTPSSSSSWPQLPEKVMLRFVLPVSPVNKLEAEVATITWLTRHTRMALPVLLYDTSGSNPLELEWLITEAVEGWPLAGILGDCTCATALQGLKPRDGRGPPRLDHARLTNISRTLRVLFARLQASNDNYIAPVGSIHKDYETNHLAIGRMASEHLSRTSDVRFWGPFACMEDYLVDYFRVACMNAPGDQEKIDMKDHLIAELTREDGGEWMTLLKKLTARGISDALPIVVSHTGLHAGNILIDDEGEVLAVMGWENAVCFPKAWRPHIDKLYKSVKDAGANDVFSRTLADALLPFVWFDRYFQSGVDTPCTRGCPEAGPAVEFGPWKGPQ